MRDSELYGKTFKLPDEIIKRINSVLISNPTGEGVKRAKFLLKNKEVTHESLKRLKHFFDHFNSQNDSKLQYELAGGKLMNDFVNNTLNAERGAVNRSHENTRDINANVSTNITNTEDLNN